MHSYPVITRSSPPPCSAHEQGKVLLANGHWFHILKPKYRETLLGDQEYNADELGANPTYLEAGMFKALTPMIMIRHPAVTVDSIYGTSLGVGWPPVESEHFKLIAANWPLRVLFDYFRAQGRGPVVVDGDDVLWRTEELARGICDRLGHGLKATKFAEKWDATSPEVIENMDAAVYKITKDYHDSTGIQRPATKPPEPDVETYYQLWKEKYGAEVAEQLKGHAQSNMPHCEYLKQFKA